MHMTMMVMMRLVAHRILRTRIGGKIAQRTVNRNEAAGAKAAMLEPPVHVRDFLCDLGESSAPFAVNVSKPESAIDLPPAPT